MKVIMTHKIWTVFAYIIMLSISGIGLGSLTLYQLYVKDIPNYQELQEYYPAVTSRVYAGNGVLLAEYAKEKRVFVPISSIPKQVVYAFLSAEDKTFYNHSGVDFPGMLRAVFTNLLNSVQGNERRPIGASTITQQVAKIFFLTSEVALERKIKEIILAFRIEQAYSKDRILELYLNEIYFGLRSNGIAAAALNYFNKSLDELTIAETAYLAALPKGPENYHPIRHARAAKDRRDWVILKMEENGYISHSEAEQAVREPLVMRPQQQEQFIDAAYFLAEVRRTAISQFGEKELYEQGLTIKTSLDWRLQQIANQALWNGLVQYDLRHGYRGPITTIVFNQEQDWIKELKKIPTSSDLHDWLLAVVLETQEKHAIIGLKNGQKGQIQLDEMKWARLVLANGSLSPSPKKTADVLKRGDVIIVEQIVPQEDTNTTTTLPFFRLRQIPQVSGGIIALDPHTGRVLAMTGGWDFNNSQFNRVTQAQRQPGSAFKPFVYMAALDNGYTPATILLDAPILIDQGPGQPKWRPENYSQQYYGPSTMRLGIVKSRNLMTIRLAQAIGMDKIVDYAKKFGINDQLSPVLAMSLGAGETTLLKLTTAYAMIVNGGRQIIPSVIDRVQDRFGRTLYRHDQRNCISCTPDTPGDMPLIEDKRAQLIPQTTAYQMVSLLEGVVQNGTGVVIKSIGKPLAGKTGTTNDHHDAWFIGFSPDLVVGVYIGYDQPTSLGGREEGGTLAAPIFKNFMEQALQDKPAIPFRIPPGIRFVRIDSKTGKLTNSNNPDAILEVFKAGTEPTPDGQPRILNDNQQNILPLNNNPVTTDGVDSSDDGLY